MVAKGNAQGGQNQVVANRQMMEECEAGLHPVLDRRHSRVVEGKLDR